MKAGVVYPQTELGGDTGAVKAFAQAAEDLGYDHIVIYDHVLGAVHEGREPNLTGPYKENDPFHEPLVTYAYLAGITKNLGLTILVLLFGGGFGYRRWGYGGGIGIGGILLIVLIVYLLVGRGGL